MKNKLRFIIAIFALLTLSGLVSAQNNEEIEKLSEGKIERPPQQRTIIQTDEMLLRGKPCPLQMQQVITAGLVDNLAPPPDPTYKTPAFLSVFSGVPFKDFDDKTVNRAFGHSFLLKNIKACESKLCTASLEIRVCNFGTDLWTNDWLYVGTIENGKINAWAYAAGIWNAQTDKGKCKIINVPLTAGTLNSKPTLDVYVQDDTAVDYIKLTLNY